ncbi:MAG: protein-L-isoaspartate(D-aspartate) O-methyltransferase [Pseudomonadota bacterium]|nr:protein-L-isoaspartate(D-aspartate) O-methyltransferase [Pseudomonadota bacterium]
MTANNLHQAHQNMVEHQVRPWDVLDNRVLKTLAQISRADYVPAAYKALAYADTAIPLAYGEVMMHPVVEGRMLQSLNIQPMDDVLEIGTGTGYITACLAHLAAHVDSADIHEEFTRAAITRLRTHGIFNATLATCDASQGLQPGKSWDVIVITGAMHQIPDFYRQSLRPNGRLFVITGEAPVMQARLITRTGEQAWAEQVLFETSLLPLQHAEKKKQFVF